MTSSVHLSFACVLVACASPAPSGAPIVSNVDGGIGEGAPAIEDGRDQRCVYETYASGDCDQCQNDKCCMERFACYDDKACYWADWLFDKCKDALPKDAGPDDSGGWDSCGADAGTCWGEFEKNGGPLSKALYDCIDKHCHDKCKLP